MVAIPTSRSTPLAPPAVDRLQTHGRADLDAVRAALDPAAADALEWAFRTWVAWIELSAAPAPPPAPPSVSPAGSSQTQLLQTQLLQIQLLQIQLLQIQLLQTIAALHQQQPRPLLRDLAYRAYDAAHDLIEHLQTTGTTLDPFRGETAADRADRSRRYLTHLRDVLDDDDRQILAAARLRRLR